MHTSPIHSMYVLIEESYYMRSRVFCIFWLVLDVLLQWLIAIKTFQFSFASFSWLHALIAVGWRLNAIRYDWPSAKCIFNFTSMATGKSVIENR